MFAKEWFSNIFDEFPILLEFVTRDIQASSDSIQLKELNEWQKALYLALFTRTDREVPRAFELERTLLSIMFLYAIQPQCLEKGGLDFIRHNGSNLEAEDIDKLRNLGITIDFEKPECKLFILATIFSDIGKVNKIRHYFTVNYGLVSQDQDLAHDYILSLNDEILKNYFQFSDVQIHYLKANRFPLHLGHAAQAECTAKKYIEAKEFLMQIEATERESRINFSIFKQICDVAGARGQNGTILLNKIILNTYLRLKDILTKLAVTSSNPEQIYWQYVADIIKIEEVTFSDPSLKDIPTDKPIFSKQALVFRLILQLRLDQQVQEKKLNDILLAEKIISNLLQNDIAFNNSLEHLADYDRLARHTFTYGPAIFATLKSKAEQNLDLIQSIAISPIEFAIKVGIRLQGIACQQYLDLAKKAPLLMETPLNFNKLNLLFSSSPEVAVNIYQGKEQLRITASGMILIGNGKSHDISNFKWEVVDALKKNNKNFANKIFIRYLKTAGMLVSKEKSNNIDFVSFDELENKANFAK